MAVTADAELAARMRLLSLHGLSHDAWDRYSGNGSWDYRILAPGYKYNMTDIAAAIGIHQLARAEEMRQRREEIAHEYMQRLADVDEIELPAGRPDRLHAWHLFPIRLRLELLSIDRDRFIRELGERACRAPSTGGRCTCILTTSNGFAGVPPTCPSPPRCGRVSSACRCSRKCAATKSTRS